MSGGVTDQEIQAILWTQRADAEGVQKVWAACKVRMGELNLPDPVLEKFRQVNIQVIQERDTAIAGKLLAEQSLVYAKQQLESTEKCLTNVQNDRENAQRGTQLDSGYLTSAVNTLSFALENLLDAVDPIAGQVKCKSYDVLDRSAVCQDAWAALKASETLVEQARVEAEAAEVARETEQETASHKGEYTEALDADIARGMTVAANPPVESPPVNASPRSARARWAGRRDPNAPKKPEIFSIFTRSNGYAVESPYDAGFVEDMKALGGKWAPNDKVWIVPPPALLALAKAFKAHYGISGPGFTFETRYERIGGVLKALSAVK